MKRIVLSIKDCAPLFHMVVSKFETTKNDYDVIFDVDFEKVAVLPKN